MIEVLIKATSYQYESGFFFLTIRSLDMDMGMPHFNSLAPAKYDCALKSVIFKLISRINIFK